MQLENSEENLKQTNQGNLKCLPIQLGTFSIPRSKTYTPQLTLLSPKPPRAAASQLMLRLPAGLWGPKQTLVTVVWTLLPAVTTESLLSPLQKVLGAAHV